MHLLAMREERTKLTTEEMEIREKAALVNISRHLPRIIIFVFFVQMRSESETARNSSLMKITANPFRNANPHCADTIECNIHLHDKR